MALPLATFELRRTPRASLTPSKVESSRGRPDDAAETSIRRKLNGQRQCTKEVSGLE